MFLENSEYSFCYGNKMGEAGEDLGQLIKADILG